MSTYPRRSTEFKAEIARIQELADKGGASLRSSYAADKRLRAKVVAAATAAGVTFAHPYMRVEDMIGDLALIEEASPEATFRRILAGEQDAEAAKLEAKGGPRRLERAENLREHARLHRIQADQAEAPALTITPGAEAVIEEIAAGLPTNRFRVVAHQGAFRIFDHTAGCFVTGEGTTYQFKEDAEAQANDMNDPPATLDNPYHNWMPDAAPVDPRSWEAVRQTPAFAVAVDIARQERRSQVKLDQARSKLVAVGGDLVDQEDAADNFSAALRFFRNDNNVLWGAARMLAAMVDNDDELGALQVLRDELDRQDGAGCTEPVISDEANRMAELAVNLRKIQHGA
jgi:hypothetical protein